MNTLLISIQQMMFLIGLLLILRYYQLHCTWVDYLHVARLFSLIVHCGSACAHYVLKIPNIPSRISQNFRITYYSFINFTKIMFTMHMMSVILENRVFPLQTLIQNLHCCPSSHACMRYSSSLVQSSCINCRHDQPNVIC